MTISKIPEKVELELKRYSPILRRLLFNRGIKTYEEARSFIFPSYDDDTHDPFLMLGMSGAVNRFYNAVKNNEKIFVYSDYDCDGIPGAVIMRDLFRVIGYDNFEIYIPDRHKEGYGLNMNAVSDIIDRGAKLLITIDLGITAVDEVKKARDGGVDVIITDHHLPQSSVPDALFILNPKQENDTYPYDMLCGSGVIFKFVQAFVKAHGEEFDIREGWEKWCLDMVGIATLADMVPLVGENRVFAYYGMKVLKKTRRSGLLQLFRKSNIKTENLQEDDITFTVCPRLNAAGRMDHPKHAFDLLASESDSDAAVRADYLTKINNQRKTLVASIMRSVNKKIVNRDDKSVIVAGDPSWQAGVLGLVAGKIVDKYNKPAFVWGLEGGDIIKGSCRSSGEINLVEMMENLPEGSLLDFGGHAAAGGFSVSHEEIHFLEDRLDISYKKTKKHEILVEKDFIIDAELSLDDVSEDFFNEINQLAPFGVSNPKPAFLFPKIKVSSIRKFGKNNEHIEIVFNSDKGRQVKAIEFFKSYDDLPEKVKDGGKIDLIANIEKSIFGYKKEIRLRIIDIK